ncbi:MAG: GAF domain-containing protein [Nanoarchaeota archaeon]|nr:GAF domain-containing protein [Nanoarchaeota archaeon]
MSRKQEFYKIVQNHYQEHLHGTDQLIPRMATLTAALKEKIPYYAGCGFYFAEQPEMEVGPYQGNIVCAKIGYNGICGAATKTKKPVIVDDTKTYKGGRIICDEKTRSELALSVYDPEGHLVAVFYAEAHTTKAFDKEDILYLEKMFKQLFS